MKMKSTTNIVKIVICQLVQADKKPSVRKTEKSSDLNNFMSSETYGGKSTYQWGKESSLITLKKTY